MTPSKNCIDLIKRFEGLKLKSYLCPAKIATIGYGSTMWIDSKPVKLGEVITIEGAEKLLMLDLKKRSAAIQNLNLNQNQFDSILSFIYNIGIGAFQRSTLLKKIKVNPNDPTIKDEFLRWVNKGSAFESGLTKRRLAEAKLYYEKM
jgi:lysozyme